MDTTRTTVNLPKNELEPLKRLAERRGVSFTHALRQAIQSELFIQNLVDQGAQLLVKLPDGDIQQLVFTQARVPAGAGAG